MLSTACWVESIEARISAISGNCRSTPTLSADGPLPLMDITREQSRIRSDSFWPTRQRAIPASAADVALKGRIQTWDTEPAFLTRFRSEAVQTGVGTRRIWRISASVTEGAAALGNTG